MYFIRYRSRNHIDSPKDLLVVIIGVAVCMVMKYYLPKIIPGMSNKTVERVSCGDYYGVVYIHNLKEVKTNGKNYNEDSARRDGRR